jgi:hypothetical protein
MHYGALKIPFCEKKRHKAAEIMQRNIFFYRLVKAMCGLALSKTYINGPTEAYFRGSIKYTHAL